MAQYINREKLLKRMEGYCEANCGCKPHEDALCPSCGLGDAIYMVEEQRIVNSKNMRGRKKATVALSKTEKTTRMRDFNTVKSDLIRHLNLSCQKTDGEILWYAGTLELLVEFLSIFRGNTEDAE